MNARSIIQIARTMPWQIRGGMETHAWQLAQAWRRRGWQVDIITTSYEDRNRVEQRDGIRVHHIAHLPHNRHELPLWRWWNHFSARVHDYVLAHDLRADIVHSESGYGHELFRHLRKKQPDTARIYTIHGTTLQVYNETGRPRLVQEIGVMHPRAMAQWAYVKLQTLHERHLRFPAAHRIVAVSEELREHLEKDYGFPANRIDVIPNGVNKPHRASDRDRLRAQFGLPSDAVILLYVGRLEPSKGIDKVLPYLRHDPRGRLLIVGAGSDEARLRDLAQQLPNPAAVRFVGAVPDDVKLRMLTAADVLVLPSEAEGQPIVMVEALAAGTPVYASRPWVPRELRSLVATDPDPVRGVQQALAMAPSVRARADDVATRYSWDEVARRYDAVFQRARL